jgi:hypothetical protein
MNPEYRIFGGKFAQAVIAQDYEQAWSYLAPWLQTTYTPDKLQGAVQKQIAEICEGFEMEPVAAPGAFQLDGNSLSLPQLRETVESTREWMPEQPPIPDEVTEANFKKWAVIEFMPSPEEESEVDAWMDFWFSIVEVDGALKIGHFNIEDPD